MSNPNQPRVPAGSSDGGQFASSGGGGVRLLDSKSQIEVAKIEDRFKRGIQSSLAFQEENDAYNAGLMSLGSNKLPHYGLRKRLISNLSTVIRKKDKVSEERILKLVSKIDRKHYAVNVAFGRSLLGTKPLSVDAPAKFRLKKP